MPNISRKLRAVSFDELADFWDLVIEPGLISAGADAEKVLEHSNFVTTNLDIDLFENIAKRFVLELPNLAFGRRLEVHGNFIINVGNARKEDISY